MRDETILIVDDNPDNLTVLAQTLRQNGYQVRPANSGSMALTSLHYEPADLILLDIRMPAMDGYEVCRRLKADPVTRDIPVIFISAMSDTHDKVKAFEAGGVDYVTKPFNTLEVLARVETHLKLCHLQRQLQRHNQELEEVVAQRTSSLRESSEGMHKALQARGDLLNLISHEFRTPLNIILGTASLLMGQLSGRQLDSVRIIEKGGLRLLTLVEDMLQVVRTGAGSATAEGGDQEPIDVEEIGAECLSAFSSIASQKDIRLSLAVAEIPLLQTTMTAARLRHILENLMDNAVKYAPLHGSVELSGRYDEAAHVLILRVRDSGPGIPPAERSRIFEPFVQLEGLNNRSHEGLGLGLTLARNLAQLHGGRVEYLASPGTGSIFQLHLPAQRSSQERKEPRALHGFVAPQQTASFERLPAAHAERLAGLLATGRMTKIIEFAVDLERDGCCPELSKAVSEMVRRFDIKALRRLLETQSAADK